MCSSIQCADLHWFYYRNCSYHSAKRHLPWIRAKAMLNCNKRFLFFIFAQLLPSVWRNLLTELFLQIFYLLFLTSKQMVQVSLSSFLLRVWMKRKYNFWKIGSLKTFLQSNEKKNEKWSLKMVLMLQYHKSMTITYLM